MLTTAKWRVDEWVQWSLYTGSLLYCLYKQGITAIKFVQIKDHLYKVYIYKYKISPLKFI